MKFDLNTQYPYFKSPVYCQVDESLKPCDYMWILLDGNLDAPQAIPRGGLTGRDKFGTTCYKWFVTREQICEKEKEELDELADKLIQDVLDEMKKEG